VYIGFLVAVNDWQFFGLLLRGDFHVR
jgi:hypothetical protein